MCPLDPQALASTAVRCDPEDDECPEWVKQAIEGIPPWVKRALESDWARASAARRRRDAATKERHSAPPAASGSSVGAGAIGLSEAHILPGEGPRRREPPYDWDELEAVSRARALGSSTTRKVRQPGWTARILDTGYVSLTPRWAVTEDAESEGQTRGDAQGASSGRQEELLSVPPPEPDVLTPRHSDRLTRVAVGGIVGSCIKAEQIGHPMRTFGTATFGRRRSEFQAGEASIGTALSRLFENWNRELRRRGDPLLRYVWVAENPWSRRTQGERNPHAHFLTSWSCPRSQFEEEAARVERWWHLGDVHLEPVRKSAPGYLLKGAGYLGKGGGEVFPEQGPVRGNRWGRSQDIIPREVARVEVELHPMEEAALRWLQLKVMEEKRAAYFDEGFVHRYGLTVLAPGGVEGLRGMLKLLPAFARVNGWRGDDERLHEVLGWPVDCGQVEP